MLPKEIWTLIFNNLTNKNIILVSFVCKYFQEIINDDIFWIDKTKNVNVYNSLKNHLSLHYRNNNKKLIYEYVHQNATLFFKIKSFCVVSSTSEFKDVTSKKLFF